MIRLAANTGCTLHLVEPLGFTMEDRLLRRAGLGYHEWAEVRRHRSWPALCAAQAPPPARCFAFMARAGQRFDEVDWQPGDWLIFGREDRGLPVEVIEAMPPPQRLRLPMRPGQRSLNLSNAVAVAVYEAWRRCGYHGST